MLPDRALVAVDLVVVASFEGFVPKKVHLLEFVQKLQAVGFVPAFRENIEADLSANRVFQRQVGKLPLQALDQLLPDLALLVILLESIPLLL